MIFLPFVSVLKLYVNLTLCKFLGCKIFENGSKTIDQINRNLISENKRRVQLISLERYFEMHFQTRSVVPWQTTFDTLEKLSSCIARCVKFLRIGSSVFGLFGHFATIEFL